MSHLIAIGWTLAILAGAFYLACRLAGFFVGAIVAHFTDR
jgi:hypothetical protein